eukprot:CAMPEP_0184984726 /NCGR_PEP_ID=MMETSP1098-20130426/13635_1 /TAXON_ID=89044 /ORGANISM="Spumella elongata, Strain CCAP 955/1" /LENGTH=105 /DNA_ID=CAMNT_0027508749 /DNA_START=93 /DNA_END=410 /DNA_ORIENTATION=-
MFSTRITGRVKFFDQTKGFGFITPSDGSSDLFAHWSNVKSDGFKGLTDDEEVEFEVATDEANNKQFAKEISGINGALLACQKPRERREFSERRPAGGNNKRRDQY